MKFLSFVMAVMACVGLAFGEGYTPVENLQLVGSANGNNNNFTNLNSVVVGSGSNSVILSNNSVSISGVAITTNSINTWYDTSVVVSNKVSSNELASTTLGSEGIRMIGALGGYTLEEFFEDTAVSGPSRDKPVFIYSNAPTLNLNVSWSNGDVYSPGVGYFHLAAQSKLLVDNAVNYAYWDQATPTLIKWTTGTAPGTGYIILARFITQFGMIVQVDETHVVGDRFMSYEQSFKNIFPSVVVTGGGLMTYATGTTLSNIAQTAGVEYQDMLTYRDHHAQNLSDTNLTLGLSVYAHTNIGVWGYSITNVLPIDVWDTGSNTIACTETNWYRGVFISFPGDPFLHWILPQTYYTNETDAINGTDPSVPSSYATYIPKTTAYIFNTTDTVLRTESKYWVDRRRLPYGTSVASSSSGGTTTIPTLDQVMLAGNNLGGILPTGAGLPVSPYQLASKQYVDSTINNVNARRAYVDDNGDDVTAQLESSILPYKKIQTAINAAALVANDTNRFVVCVSPGIYNENIAMSNYVSIQGIAIEPTEINGSLTYPPAYTDVRGSEVSLLRIYSTNMPAVVINAGSDTAYVGLRSCAIYANYDSADITNKSVLVTKRCVGEVYATTYFELNVTSTNGLESKAQIFEHVTDLANPGLSQFSSHASSCAINCTDTNDEVSLAYTHDNTDTKCINTIMDGIANIHLDTPGVNYYNKIKTVSHDTAIGRTLLKGVVTRLYLNDVNNCNLFISFAKNGTGDNVAISRNNHIRVASGYCSNIWFGAATTTKDSIRVFDTEVIQGNTTNYPRKYTSEGSLGHYYINTPDQNGDHIFGGALDISTLSTIGQSIPETGHVRMYANTYAGLENVMFQDSSGNIGRYARDNFFNGYNAETTTLQIGEAVYVTTGLSADQTPIIKRCDASDPSTFPCDGVVIQVGNIATGAVGRVMRTGRTESTFNTSAFTSGDKLYVPVKINNLSIVTNVPPNGTNVVQLIGKAHLIGVNGKITVFPSNPDTMGGRVPQEYMTYSSPKVSDQLFMLTNSAAAKFSTADITAGTTNTYILPAVGGVLATYTDIQLVPVSVIIGETGGIQKGRVVYQSGSDLTGRPIVKYADCHDTTKLPVIGVTTASGNLGDIIEVANFGPVRNIDTSAFTQNALMYLGTNGVMSGIPTVASDAAILLGTCLLSNSTTGSMLVNIREYFQDGAYQGSMRYAIKNAATGTTSAANFFVYNNVNEAMRMGIRCEGHQWGKGDFIVGDAGQMIFGNTRRNRFVWSIDMQDTTNIYNHNNWPMMALVPQQVTSNAFLGVGTTNPLAMLDIRGNIVGWKTYSTNSYRLSSNGYTNNELIAYGDTTNLIGVVNSNLQSQISIETNRAITAELNLTNFVVSVSNAAYSYNTNLLARINTETNRAITAELNLTNFVVSVSNAAYSYDTNLLARINTETNRAITAELNLTNFVVSVSNAAYSYDTNLLARINTETNRAITAETNLQGQVTSATNRLQTLEDMASTVQFLANVGTTLNPTFGAATVPVLFTNVVYSHGGIYSNTATVARWIPGVSNVVVKIQGSMGINSASQPIMFSILLYKNGGLKSTMMKKYTTSNTDDWNQNFSYVDVTTNSADYYEIYVTSDKANQVMTGSGADNWWAGQIVY